MASYPDDQPVAPPPQEHGYYDAPRIAPPKSIINNSAPQAPLPPGNHLQSPHFQQSPLLQHSARPHASQSPHKAPNHNGTGGGDAAPPLRHPNSHPDPGTMSTGHVVNHIGGGAVLPPNSANLQHHTYYALPPAPQYASGPYVPGPPNYYAATPADHGSGLPPLSSRLTHDVNLSLLAPPGGPGNGVDIDGGMPLGHNPPAPPQQLHQQRYGYAAARDTHDRDGRSSGLPRKRSLTACDSCRQKKTKCDNVRPRCGLCVRAGIDNCRYRTDDVSEPWAGDQVLHTILQKLDSILQAVQGPPRPLAKRRQTLGGGSGSGAAGPRHYLLAQVWNMSLTTLLRWPFFQKTLRVDDAEAATVTRRLLRDYETLSLRSTPLPSQQVLREAPYLPLEHAIAKHLHEFANLFILNCHTKVPCVDVVTLFEMIEMFVLLRRSDESVTLWGLLDEHLRRTLEPPARYHAALEKCGVADDSIRQRAYRGLCQSVPLLLVICALGAALTSLQLDNIGKFELLLEERAATSLCCVPGVFEIANVPSDRGQLAHGFVAYAQSLLLTYLAAALEPNSLESVQYHVLLSQFYLYMMSPLWLHREILAASHDMTFYLEKENILVHPEEVDFELNGRTLVVNRLFWTCLKLECELRTELSPYVALSGISQITPPWLFVRIPSPVKEENHLPECVRLANRYDDLYLWLFFLTEIAVRKVDNRLCDEIYSATASRSHLWDLTQFVNRDVWRVAVWYLTQYNGIISLLPPLIRNFVVSEIDVNEVYTSMKKKAAARRAKEPENFLDTLDDFLISDTLLVQAQSESVMFIKTRIIASKLALFRPLIYLILEDHISVVEILEAAAAVLPLLAPSGSTKPEFDDLPFTDSAPRDSSEADSSATLTFWGEDMANFDVSDPQFAKQTLFPDEDFSDLVDRLLNSADDSSMQIEDYGAVRRRVLQALVRNLITIPKLNIPKIGAHRHPGLWYYVRNLTHGVLMQFLLYQKVQEFMASMARSQNGQLPPPEIVDGIMRVFSKESLLESLEHSLLIINYWKSERSDCAVYADYISRCIEQLS